MTASSNRVYQYNLRAKGKEEKTEEYNGCSTLDYRLLHIYFFIDEFFMK